MENMSNTQIRQWIFENAELNEDFDEITRFVSGDSFESRGYSAALVLEEAFMNVMNYAYKNIPVPRSPVMISVTKTGDGDTDITFVDMGEYFDPTKHDYTKKTAGAVGGQGIKILNLYTKKMEYFRAGQANVLHLVI